MSLITTDNIQKALEAFYDKVNTKYATKTELDGKADFSHGTHLTLGTTSSTAFRGDRGNTAYNHSQAAHAPSNAQKNSDITKQEIEDKLTGAISSHSHNNYLQLTGGTLSGNVTFNNAKGIYGKTAADLTDYDGATVAAGTGGSLLIFNNSHNFHIGALISDRKLNTGSTYLYGGTSLQLKVNNGSIGLYPSRANTWMFASDKSTTNRPIVTNFATTTYLKGNQGTAMLNSAAAAGAYTTVVKTNSTNGYFTLSNYNQGMFLNYTDKATVDAETNAVTKTVKLLDESGNAAFPGALDVNGKLTVNFSPTADANTALKVIAGESLFDHDGNWNDPCLNEAAVIKADGRIASTGDITGWGKVLGNGSLETYGIVRSPSYELTNSPGGISNLITGGNGDGADWNTHNLVIRSHWGIGFRDYLDRCHIVLDTRNGSVKALGDVYAGSTLVSEGGLTTNGNITTQGQITAQGNLYSKMQLLSEGGLHTNGNMTTGAELGVYGNAHFHSGVYFNDKVIGETKFSMDGAWYDPWNGIGCAIKTHGNIAATGIVRATDRMEINGVPISIQSAAPTCGGVWIQF